MDNSEQDHRYGNMTDGEKLEVLTGFMDSTFGTDNNLWDRLFDNMAGRLTIPRSELGAYLTKTAHEINDLVGEGIFKGGAR